MLAEAYIRSGKVRDLYAMPGGRIALVASDRISAFDVVLPTEIPDKGKVLTGLSRYWFAETESLVPNHLLSTTTDDPALRGRLMICRSVEVIPIEAVVRGYLAGSGWKAYLASGSVCGVTLPRGLREGDRLPEPIFTPATKAEMGEHDENIDFETMARLVGHQTAERVRDLALGLYAYASERTERAGILLADTKFEFGVDSDSGRILLIDEVLTPDSSRFWDASTHEPGRPQASFDKQFVRDWLERQPWDKTAPGPELPPDVVDGTRSRYVEAYERITGATFERYLAEDVIAPVTSFRYAVNVTPKPGILDPAGRAVERSLGHLGIDGVRDVRIGRRAELTVEAADEAAAMDVIERLASELLSNPLIEVWGIEPLAASPVVPAGAGEG